MYGNFSDPHMRMAIRIDPEIWNRIFSAIFRRDHGRAYRAFNRMRGNFLTIERFTSDFTIAVLWALK
ncbi:hypothetical protein [Caulobacter radicis]|uniref:hypothetical protein n=1 Tax=Caulobacter radicis TaxID=2172650 RepID=UPI001057B9B9|nr:hypothetical protein [Caulobacter radicis]